MRKFFVVRYIAPICLPVILLIQIVDHYKYWSLLSKTKNDTLWMGNQNADDSASCSPINKVIFAKTHKTGSSTVQNIFLRYVHGANMTMVHPVKHSWVFQPLTEPFKANNQTVKGYSEDPQATFDAFVFHANFQYDEVRRLVPEGPAITLLRDPVTMFESGYSFFGWDKIRGINEYVQTIVKTQKPKRNPQSWFGKNEMLWDLGLPPADMEDVNLVKAKIKEVEKNFDVVMIAEKMEESLVVLHDVLCWPLANLTFLDQLARKSSDRVIMTQETREILHEYLWADQLLYDHFTAILDKKMEALAMKGQVNLEKLRAANIALKERCIESESDRQHGDLAKDFKPIVDKVQGYNIKEENAEECQYFAMTEPRFVFQLRERQFPNAPK